MTPANFLRIFLTSSFASLALAAPQLQATNSTPHVDLGYEIHQGIYNETGQFYNFSNIRYAAPPLGNLRFSAPADPPVTSPVPINDGSYSPVCPNAIPLWTSVVTQWFKNGIQSLNQTAGYTSPPVTNLSQHVTGTNEDCLFLDVKVPKDIFEQRGTRKPAAVLVWIHGGGYTLGWKTQYGSGAGLVAASLRNGKEGVIFVAINYRVGIFGFLSGPSFQENGTANAGLLDQRKALEWVQTHISKFGGDPNRVTVIGESAGGGSTLHQLTAYGGLKGKVPFQQAIVQSGAFLPMPTNQKQEAIFRNFLLAAGVDTLQEARNLSTEKLQLANLILVGQAPFGDFTFNPTVDGHFAPALPGKLLLQGGYDTSVKVLIGHNGDEGLEFTSPYCQSEEDFQKNVILVSFPNADVSNITNYIMEDLYPPVLNGTYGYTRQVDRADKIVSEALFSCNANYLSRAFGSNAYHYMFNVPPALHGQDITYTFYEGPAASVVNDTLALLMQDWFTNFAISGTPNRYGLEPYFPDYGQGGNILQLNTSVISLIPDPLENPRCRWWQKALY